MSYNKTEIKNFIAKKIEVIIGNNDFQADCNINDIMNSIDIVHLIIELETQYSIVLKECIFENISITNLTEEIYKKTNCI